jgi:hypothetical protein
MWSLGGSRYPQELFYLSHRPDKESTSQMLAQSAAGSVIFEHRTLITPRG